MKQIEYPIIVRDIRDKKPRPPKKYAVDGSMYDSIHNYREFANFDECEYKKLSVDFHFTLVLVDTNSLFFVKYKCVLLDDDNKIVVAKLMEDKGIFVRPDDYLYPELYNKIVNKHRFELIDNFIKDNQ